MAHDGEQEVGYRKPPKTFQFQKGRSGNPSGRPRKRPGIPELLWKVAKQKVLTNGKNGPSYMTKLEACCTQLANKGTIGDLKAAKLFIEMLTGFPESIKREDREAMAGSAKTKLLALFEARAGSLAEDAAGRDRPSTPSQGNTIDTENLVVTVRSDDAELKEATVAADSVKVQPVSKSAGDRDRSMPITQCPAQERIEPKARCPDPPP